MRSRWEALRSNFGLEFCGVAWVEVSHSATGSAVAFNTVKGNDSAFVDVDSDDVVLATSFAMPVADVLGGGRVDMHLSSFSTVNLPGRPFMTTVVT